MSSTGSDPAASAGRRILVVDDDVMLREVIVTLLRRRGYDVYEAEHGRDVVNNHALGTFDLVITDIVMPQMEGLEVIRWLRSRFGRRTRIIAISGEGGDRVLYLRHAALFGADATLPKPFAPPDLLDLIARQLAMVEQPAA
ncbi:MAG: response regulator [Alphaproteobacteria bacterium]|nr:response regulator [Alphaproteobacteria bacterium]